MGEIEGCGTGTVHFSAPDIEGFYDGPMPTYTRHTWEVVPGGTLPVDGSFEALGLETLLSDYLTTFDFSGELSCAASGTAEDA